MTSPTTHTQLSSENMWYLDKLESHVPVFSYHNRRSITVHAINKHNHIIPKITASLKYFSISYKCSIIIEIISQFHIHI